MNKKYLLITSICSFIVLLICVFLFIEFNRIKKEGEYTINLNEKSGLEIYISDLKTKNRIPIFSIDKEEVPIDVKYKLKVKAEKDGYSLSLTNLNSKTKDNRKENFDESFKYFGYVDISKSNKSQLGYIVFTDDKKSFKEPTKAENSKVLLVYKRIIK